MKGAVIWTHRNRLVARPTGVCFPRRSGKGKGGMEKRVTQQHLFSCCVTAKDFETVGKDHETKGWASSGLRYRRTKTPVGPEKQPRCSSRNAKPFSLQMQGAGGKTMSLVGEEVEAKERKNRYFQSSC